MGTAVKKIQCPKCLDTGQDNLIIYEDGSDYCFACGHSSRKKLDAIYTGPMFVVYEDLPHRKLSKETCVHFRYGISDGKEAAIYTDTAVKYRNKDKKIWWEGDTSDILLFGQQLYAPTPNLFVTVVEGEIDAMSVAQVCGLTYPVVSIAKGSKEAKKGLTKALEWLQGFKYVILGFDNDEAGKKATEECVTLFEPGKVRIAKWALKDANELLVAGREKEIKKAIWEAQVYLPDRLYSLEDINQMDWPSFATGLSFPWEKFTRYSGGISAPLLILIGAGPGTGKTTLTNQIVLHAAQQHGLKVGLFSFEHTIYDNYLKILGLSIKQNIDFLGKDSPEVKKAYDHLKEIKKNLFLYDSVGVENLDSIIQKIRYLNKAKDVSLFIIDTISNLIVPIEGDERRGIDSAMTAFDKLTKELRCTIIITSHFKNKEERVRSTNGYSSRSWDEGLIPSLGDFRGSGAIGAKADVAFGLTRNIKETSKTLRSTIDVICLKTRRGRDMAGETFKLKYNIETGLLEDYKDELI